MPRSYPDPIPAEVLDTCIARIGMVLGGSLANRTLHEYEQEKARQRGFDDDADYGDRVPADRAVQS